MARDGRAAGWGELGSGPLTRWAPSPGAAALLLLLPAIMFHLLLVARSGPARLLGLPPHLPAPEALWSPGALLLWLTWLGLQAAFYLLPARKVWACLADARVSRAEGRAQREERPPRPLSEPLCACRWLRARN